MRRYAGLFAAMIALGFALSSASITAASASPAGVSPNLHYAGQKCKTVHSPQNFAATICAITNASDLSGEQDDQALATFTIKSGSLAEISVKVIYLHSCFNSCVNQNEKKNVVKFPSGKSGFISNPFAFDPDNAVQAVVETPCLQWTNGQAVCYNGTIKDTIISTH